MIREERLTEAKEKETRDTAVYTVLWLQSKACKQHTCMVVTLQWGWARS